MAKVSPHFMRQEFECKCGCGYNTIDCGLLKILEIVRNRFAQPITINSACRCEDHNAHIGGSELSKHKEAKAADIVVKNVHPDTVADFLEMMYPNNLGIGRYNTFTHVDSREGKGRWDKRS